MKYKLPYPPTTKTPGNEGDLYLDVDSGTIYICKGCNTVEEIKDFVTMTLYPTPDSAEYIWEKQGGSDDALPSIISRNITGHYYNDTVTSIGKRALSWCEQLISVALPSVTTIGEQAFDTTYLEYADLASVAHIGKNAFESGIAHLIMRTEIVVAADYPPVASSTRNIYVPSDLIEQYREDSVWGKYSSRFRAIEDYTIDGTITGDLDMNKLFPES